METDVTDEAGEQRRARLECLQVEVRRREDQFLVDGGDYGYGGEWHGYKELNEYAIAEWADGLLQAQKAQMLAVVERELSR